jgi:hypothetical protein
MKLKLTLICALFSYLSLAHAFDDFLSKEELEIKSIKYEQVVELTAINLKPVFDHYKIALGSGFSIVRPLQVLGTNSNPILQGTLKKCIAFICQDVDLDASVTITKIHGPCDVNYFLKADLSRSSHWLTGEYEYFATTVCANHSADGAKGTLNSYAHRASTYGGGPIASTIFNFLLLQIEPIMNSLHARLNENIKVVEGSSR